MKKRILMLLLACGVFACSQAQILRADELETYAVQKYGDNWVEAAQNLASQLQLDQNNGLTFVQVIESSGVSKEQLYVLLNYWFTSTFNDANSVIKLNDKELGSIIAQGYVQDIAGHIGGMNSYCVSIWPIIKCDIKEERVRITYTVPFYTVEKSELGGVVGMLAGKSGNIVDQNWLIDKCFPFVEKDKHKQTSSKALVMSYAYSNVIMDKIEACFKQGMTGNENDDW
ncbi:MAG: DUF4468 domain-containing protein [Prevotellaceae bacterium]|nr:DUF4468 domain-containing protein [Prevotellaceae bacterium]